MNPETIIDSLLANPHILTDLAALYEVATGRGQEVRNAHFVNLLLERPALLAEMSDIIAAAVSPQQETPQEITIRSPRRACAPSPTPPPSQTLPPFPLPSLTSTAVPVSILAHTSCACNVILPDTDSMSAVAPVRRLPPRLRSRPYDILDAKAEPKTRRRIFRPSASSSRCLLPSTRDPSDAVAGPSRSCGHSLFDPPSSDDEIQVIE